MQTCSLSAFFFPPSLVISGQPELSVLPFFVVFQRTWPSRMRRCRQFFGTLFSTNLCRLRFFQNLSVLFPALSVQPTRLTLYDAFCGLSEFFGSPSFSPVAVAFLRQLTSRHFFPF